jgi:hypothetical protein
MLNRETPIQDAAVLRKYPALVAYLARIEAERTRNFRSHAVQEMDEDSRYWRDRARIKVEKDGTVNVSVHHKRGDEEIDAEQFAPTPEEQEAIKAEVAANPFPKSVEAAKDDLPPDLVGVDPEEYLRYLTPSGDLTTWIQWRKLDEEGRPYYVPYTLWDDNVWRAMEPDGLLPLYGLERLRPGEHARWYIMIHEGAKCARHARRLVDKKARHPWITELARYTHLGWPGGVNSADRVNWGPIKRLEVGRNVVLVCDHDVSGEDVASTISRILQRKMMVVRFDDRFPPSFDLADDWPKLDEFWRKDERYRGPTMNDCLFPATWATRVVPKAPDEKGRPAFKIVDPFVEEWLWIEEQDAFISRQQLDQQRNRKVFNSRVRAFSDVEDTARLLDRRASPKCDGIAYEPGRQPGVLNIGGKRLVNTYRPCDVKPIDGDARPFVKFMKHLFPIKSERRDVLRWCVTLVARPDVRMRYGVLTISEVQGVGKTTLGQDILAPLVGMHNVSFPSEHEIVDSGFTHWIAHKRLAVIHEIYSGKDRKAYDKLKDKITETFIDVNEKYLKPYTVSNYVHAYACSNSLLALHIDDKDRRWFVPTVTEELKDNAYWNDLHEWLRGDGLGIIYGYFLKLAKDEANLVGTGERAPSSAAKNEMIAESMSPSERIAFDLGEVIVGMNTLEEDRPEKKLEKILVAVDDVRDWVAARLGISKTDRLLDKPYMIRRALVRAGMKEPTRAPRQTRTPRFLVDPGQKKVCYVVANFPIPPGATWEELKEHYGNPDFINPK